MASGTKTRDTEPEIPSGRSRTGSPDVVIERQLRKTRARVKIIDLATAMMTLAAGILAYVLALVVVDHWVFGLGSWGRFLALVVLLGSVGWYSVTNVLPLLLGSINPVYAAKAIEESQPSLKNSLVNFLLLRDSGRAVHRIVIEAMRVRAASDLSSVSLDTAVDRSRLIRVGYVLAGVFALCGLYVILSPKSALQTVSRVTIPWAEIARPTRVEIANVTPGDDEVFQGEDVRISAEIRGISAEGEVTLRFSSADGQLVGQEIPMHVSEAGLRYACSLPPGETGIQQDLTYEIAAGDAITKQYRLSVSPAPTILVERVDYVYPEYTRRPPFSAERAGDIIALEGTKVTVRARANYDIRSASLEFDPIDRSLSNDVTAAGEHRLPMEFTGTEAWRTFTLELAADRRTQTFSSYQLGFQTPEGHASEHQVLHRIRITPDLAPEVQVLTPTNDHIEVPQDGTQPIEIRAVDPDFGLRRIVLRAVAGGTDLMDEPLLDAKQQSRPGQVVVEYAFAPAKLGLTAGDQVVYWAVAEDNRMAPSGDVPEPNVERTRNYRITITPPRKREIDPGNSDSNTESGAPEKPDESASGEGQGGTSGQGGTAGSEGSEGEDSENMDNGGNQETGGQPGERNADAANSGSSSQESEPDGSRSDQNDAASDGSSGGPSSPDGSSSDGNTPAAGDPSQSDGPQEPLHDGEVFDRVMERMQEQQNEASGESQSEKTGENKQPTGDDSGADTSPQSPSPKPNEGEPPGGDADAQKTDQSDGQTQKPSPKESDRGADGQQQQPGDTQSAPGEMDQPGNQQDANRPKDSNQQTGSGSRDPGAGQQGDEKGENDTGSGTTQDRQGSDRTGNDSESAEGAPSNQSDPSTNSSQEDGTGPENMNPSDSGDKTEPMDGDSAGQSRPTDQEGDGAAESGNRSPDEPPDGNPTGEKPQDSDGQESGPDPSSQQKPGTEKPGTGSPKPAPQTGADQDSPTRDGAGEPGSSSQNAKKPGTDGGLPSETNPETMSDEKVAEGDQPELDYARRATDMVLEYLKDQQDDPDQRLLEELGWTPEEMRIFLDRWARLKQAAEREGTERQELDETLRSLGLRPPRDRIRQNRVTSDEAGGMSESGARSSAPERYRDQIDAFKKGAARQGR